MRTILHLIAEIIRLGALVLALGCALGAVAALGGAVSNRLDVLTHFAPVWLLGATVAMAARLATGGGPGRLTLAACLIAVAAAGALMAPELLGALRQRKVAAGPDSLKVIQFNLWQRNRDPAGTVAWILKQDADVIVVEEAYPTTIVDALKGAYPYRVTCSPPTACSTMILAKAKPTASGGLADGSLKPWLLAAWATFGKGSGAYTVVGVHYTWPIPAGPQQRQSRQLGEFIDGLDKPSLILTGDFNSTPWSFSLRRQDRRFGLERRTRALFSWPTNQTVDHGFFSPLPILAIDHVYAGADWRTVSITRGPKLGSDHYPVVAVLRRTAG